jgi:iron complex transport system substrate-binding protein
LEELIMTNRWKALPAAVLMAAVVAAGCGGSSKSTESPKPTFVAEPTAIAVPTTAAFPVQVVRSDGKQLSIAAAPKRIVSMSPAATETLFAIGAESEIAAVDKNADYPDGAKNFATKVDAYEPNIESIRALNPDLVIIASDTSDGIVAKLDQLNIPVLYIDIDKSMKTLDDVFGQIGLLGQITGHTDQSAPLVADLAARVRKIEDAVQGLDQTQTPKVYHELDSTFYTASADSFIGDLYRTLRAQNIAGNGGGQAYPQMTQEAIISANPAVIILADEAFGTTVESVKARPGWSAIDAVKNSKIFGIDPNIISRPGPRIVDALEQLAKFIYPQRFG